MDTRGNIEMIVRNKRNIKADYMPLNFKLLKYLLIFAHPNIFFSNFNEKITTLSDNLKYNNIDNKTGKGDPTTTFNPLKVPCSGNFVSYT